MTKTATHLLLIHMHRTFLRAVAIASLLSSSLRAQAAPTARAMLVSRLDSIVQNAMQIKTAGIQVAVVKGRDTLLMKGYGLANAEDDVAVTPQTVFKIGSVTKQFTSAMVMRLIEHGRLTLDDTLGKFMPKSPLHWHRVTIRQLLNHTSGIPSYTDVGMKSYAPLMLGMRRDSIFELLRTDSLMFEPGRGFYYNNTGYFLLGMLVEQLAGKSYGAVLSEMITPLGLTQTSYCAGPEIIAHRAAGYDRQGPTLVNTAYVNMDMPFAAGSICSTARDLVMWDQALTSGKVVKAESFKMMTSPVKFSDVYPMTYGFGLTVDTMGAHSVVLHGGNINGFSSQLTYVPAESLFIAVNINVSGAPAGQIASEIARVVSGEPRKPVASRDEPVPATERALFTGTYSVGDPTGRRREFVVGEQDEHLTIQPQGAAAPAVLERQSKQVFIVRGSPTQRVLFEMANGKVTGLVIDRGVRPLMGKRVN